MQLNWILFDFVEFFKILEFLKGVKMGILVLNFGLKGWKSLRLLKTALKWHNIGGFGHA